MNLPKILKRVLTAAVALVTAVSVAGCGGGDSDTDAQVLRIATGNMAGTYYPIGRAMAEIINENVPDVHATAQSTSASIANIHMLEDGQFEMAIVQNDVAYYAVKGQNMFDKKFENLRGVASLYPETFQIVTLADSGIKTVEDLVGKRVAVGPAGSGGEANVRQVLGAYGIDYKEIDAQFLTFAEGATALLNGEVDVACVTAGYPTPAIQKIAARDRIRLIPLDAAKITTLMVEYPFFARTLIPAGTYEGVDAETPAVSVMAILITSDRMSDDTCYEVTKAIFTHTDKLAAAHKSAQLIDKKSALTGMGFMTMNDGAERYFNE